MTGSTRPRDAGPRDREAAELEEQLPALLARLDLRQKVCLLTGASYWSLRADSRIGLRAIMTSDGPAGVRGPRWDERDTSVNVPAPVALAATWDPRLAELIGGLLAAECIRKGVDMLLAPTVNLQRTPYSGRHFECFSEDPLLTAEMGGAIVRGLQASGVAAAVKHFVANDSETGRFTADVRVDERTLRELYLAPFEIIVKDARPWAVMAAYNGVNGHTMTESPMLRGILKEEWGFDGLAVSDWRAGRSAERTASAGLDLVMPGPEGPWGEALVSAVLRGQVSEAAIDDKVLRLLRLACRVGALEHAGDGGRRAAPWPGDRVTSVLRSAAASGFVLARNDGPLLPLNPSLLRRVAVIGPNAANPRTQGAGSSTIFPPYVATPLDALRAAFAPGVVDHSPGVRAHTRIPVAPAALLSVPGSAEPGAIVEFLDAAGTVLAAERRLGGFYLWRALPDGVPQARVAAVRVATTVRAQTPGPHAIGCSGLGRFRLSIDGTVAFDTRLSVPAGTDPTEAYVRPPQEHATIPLAAGQHAAVVLEHHLGGDSGPTSFILGGIAFQLNAEGPRAADGEEIERAAALARDADVAIVVVGTTQETESEGFDRTSLRLPGRQDELVRRVVRANPRTIVVVNSGAPVLLPWAADVPAILLTAFPGQEYGNALADVLLGRAEPGGRLPTTWPASDRDLPATGPRDGVLTYAEGLFIGYRAFDRAERAPLFPFGHGLGYTTWEYLDAEVSAPAMAAEAARLRVRVRNTGRFRGSETIQVYASRPASAVPRPPRWLAGFMRIEADAGEQATAVIPVPSRWLAHWDTAAGEWAVEPGGFELSAGRSSRDLRLARTLTVGPEASMYATEGVRES